MKFRKQKRFARIMDRADEIIFMSRAKEETLTFQEMREIAFARAMRDKYGDIYPDLPIV